jgi:hypothetical protein
MQNRYKSYEKEKQPKISWLYGGEESNSQRYFIKGSIFDLKKIVLHLSCSFKTHDGEKFPN